MSLWTHTGAADATGGKAQGSWQASRVIIDSRKAQAGDLFVALKGERSDGHDHAAAALSQGASAAMVSRVPAGLDKNAPLLIVPDVMKGLEALGLAARKRSRAKFIGVTGSVGKTSTKEMIHLALKPHGTVHSTSGNYNNHIGVPLTLANLPEKTSYAVLEMGMNHAGEISQLTRMVRPDIAVITGIEEVHLEFFGTVEKIADAKAEIFEGMSKNGIAVLNADNARSGRLIVAANRQGLSSCIMCGEAEDADCRLTSYRAIVGGCEISARINGQELNFRLSAVGRHWAQTALFALAVAEALKLDITKTAAALSGFYEPEGRGRVVPMESGALLIDDSYNASPVAMRAAFAKTAEIWEAGGKKGRKIAALGDMLELGPEGPRLHANLTVDLKRHAFDAVYTAGGLMKYLSDALPAPMRAAHVEAAKELLPIVKKELRANDILLVKGSHGSHMYELARALAGPSTEGKKHAV